MKYPYDTWPPYKGEPVLSTDGDYLHFNYNDGFAGEVQISVSSLPSMVREPVTISLPADVLLKFVAECYVRPQMEESLRGAPTRELLAGWPKRRREIVGTQPQEPTTYVPV